MCPVQSHGSLPEGGRRVRVGEKGWQGAGVLERWGAGWGDLKGDLKVLRCCLGVGGRGHKLRNAGGF